MTDAMAGRHVGPVLVAEREARERQALAAALRAAGRPVIEVADAAACLVAAAAPELAAVVLDLDLPGMETVALVRAVRARCAGRLVVAVAPVDGTARWRAAQAAGADDWVTRPYRVGEVEGRLRWAPPTDDAADRAGQDPGPRLFRWAHGDLELDLDRRVLRRAGSDVALTRHELGLLEVLVANPGRLLSHEALLKTVWGPAYGTESAYLRTFMSQLRRKLGDDARRPALIRTEPGLGYRWIAPAGTGATVGAAAAAGVQ
ncbi:MAG: response regulator transcription factor [Acidimicrobiales bacterium]